MAELLPNGRQLAEDLDVFIRGGGKFAFQPALPLEINVGEPKVTDKLTFRQINFIKYFLDLHFRKSAVFENDVRKEALKLIEDFKEWKKKYSVLAMGLELEDVKLVTAAEYDATTGSLEQMGLGDPRRENTSAAVGMFRKIYQITLAAIEESRKNL